MSGSAITRSGRLRAALPYVVVLAVAVYLYYLADHFEFEHVSGRIGPDAWPKLVLVLMLLTALWGVISTFLKSETALAQNAEADEEEALVRPPEIHPWLVWLAVATTLVYLFLLPLLGFFLATLFYTFALMYLGHYRRPARVALLSLVIAFCFTFMFMRIVYVALPLGVSPFNQVSYALMALIGVR